MFRKDPDTHATIDHYSRISYFLIGSRFYNFNNILTTNHSNMQAAKRIIALFDVDQTLTPARLSIQPQMIATLKSVMDKGVAIGIVSGSDLVKVTEQVTQEIVDTVDYTFSENGLYALRKGQFFAKQSIKDAMGEDKLKKFINFTLRYLSDLDIPKKRYMIYIC